MSSAGPLVVAVRLLLGGAGPERCPRHAEVMGLRAEVDPNVRRWYDFVLSAEDAEAARLCGVDIRLSGSHGGPDAKAPQLEGLEVFGLPHAEALRAALEAPGDALDVFAVAAEVAESALRIAGAAPSAPPLRAALSDFVSAAYRAENAPFLRRHGATIARIAARLGVEDAVGGWLRGWVHAALPAALRSRGADLRAAEGLLCAVRTLAEHHPRIACSPEGSLFLGAARPLAEALLALPASASPAGASPAAGVCRHLMHLLAAEVAGAAPADAEAVAAMGAAAADLGAACFGALGEGGAWAFALAEGAEIWPEDPSWAAALAAAPPEAVAALLEGARRRAAGRLEALGEAVGRGAGLSPAAMGSHLHASRRLLLCCHLSLGSAGPGAALGACGAARALLEGVRRRAGAPQTLWACLVAVLRVLHAALAGPRGRKMGAERTGAPPAELAALVRGALPLGGAGGGDLGLLEALASLPEGGGRRFQDPQGWLAPGPMLRRRQDALWGALGWLRPPAEAAAAPEAKGAARLAEELSRGPRAALALSALSVYEELAGSGPEVLGAGAPWVQFLCGVIARREGREVRALAKRLLRRLAGSRALYYRLRDAFCYAKDLEKVYALLEGYDLRGCGPLRLDHRDACALKAQLASLLRSVSQRSHNWAMTAAAPFSRSTRAALQRDGGKLRDLPPGLVLWELSLRLPPPCQALALRLLAAALPGVLRALEAKAEAPPDEGETSGAAPEPSEAAAAPPPAEDRRADVEAFLAALGRRGLLSPASLRAFVDGLLLHAESADVRRAAETVLGALHAHLPGETGAALREHVTRRVPEVVDHGRAALQLLRLLGGLGGAGSGPAAATLVDALRRCHETLRNHPHAGVYRVTDALFGAAAHFLEDVPCEACYAELGAGGGTPGGVPRGPQGGARGPPRRRRRRRRGQGRAGRRAGQGRPGGRRRAAGAEAAGGGAGGAEEHGGHGGGAAAAAAGGVRGVAARVGREPPARDGGGGVLQRRDAGRARRAAGAAALGQVAARRQDAGAGRPERRLPPPGAAAPRAVPALPVHGHPVAPLQEGLGRVLPARLGPAGLAAGGPARRGGVPPLREPRAPRRHRLPALRRDGVAVPQLPRDQLREPGRLPLRRVRLLRPRHLRHQPRERRRPEGLRRAHPGGQGEGPPRHGRPRERHAQGEAGPPGPPPHHREPRRRPRRPRPAPHPPPHPHPHPHPHPQGAAPRGRGGGAPPRAPRRRGGCRGGRGARGPRPSPPRRRAWPQDPAARPRGRSRRRATTRSARRAACRGRRPRCWRRAGPRASRSRPRSGARSRSASAARGRAAPATGGGRSAARRAWTCSRARRRWRRT